MILPVVFAGSAWPFCYIPIIGRYQYIIRNVGEQCKGTTLLWILNLILFCVKSSYLSLLVLWIFICITMLCFLKVIRDLMNFYTQVL